MIEFTEHRLGNGLQVLVHTDPDTPLAVLNLLYRVGSKNEDPERTGMAHLFEHLMFGGSEHVPQFDRELQRVGAENNAFTNCDVTNYYISLPAQNLETAFWVESDRMASPGLSAEVLEVQRSVVVEEFRQRYLNQPYGDVWHHLRPLAYRLHPYRWPTIGIEPGHIEGIGLEDVRRFFRDFYRPSNAVLVLAGVVNESQALALSEKWFGDIPDHSAERVLDLPMEPAQESARRLEINARVPLDAIWKAYHMPGRMADDYHAADLLGDVLGRGKSSRLYQSLVKEEPLFNSLQVYSTGNSDPGMLIIAGKLNPGIDPEEANRRLEEQIDRLLQHNVPEHELEKVKNQAESSILFSEAELLNRAVALAQAAACGRAALVNEEAGRIRRLHPGDLLDAAGRYLRPANGSTLFYRRQN